MKRLPFVLSGVLALTLVAAGCTTSAQKPQGAAASADTLAACSADTLPVDSLAADTLSADSLATDTLSAGTLLTDTVTSVCYSADSTVRSTVCVDYPLGDDSLSQAVKAFIGKQLGLLYVPYSYSEEAVALAQYPRYPGSVLEARPMVDYYARGGARFLEAQQSEMMCEDKVPMCSDVTISKVAETSTYVTCLMKAYYEVGGAHGSFTSYKLNISKLTNRPVESVIDSSQTRALQPILQAGIESYFKLCGEEDFRISSIFEYLDPLGEKGIDLIPLPAGTPYIERDSLCFVYQQYEIAPYAAGLVCFNVALRDIRPYLRKEVQDLIADTDSL